MPTKRAQWLRPWTSRHLSVLLLLLLLFLLFFFLLLLLLLLLFCIFFRGGVVGPKGSIRVGEGTFEGFIRRFCRAYTKSSTEDFFSGCSECLARVQGFTASPIDGFGLKALPTLAALGPP